MNIPVFRTIHEALTLGTDKLAVDGVLLIAEHGDYPFNDKEQKMYPRFELFLEIVDTFRRTGQSVPVFNDKHLSFTWTNAKRMYDISKEVHFPFMAGSSVTVNYRESDVEFPWGGRATHGVVVRPGPIDSYGFHMLETVQSLIERRAGGEKGVEAVQCLKGDAIWQFLDSTPWAKKLFESGKATYPVERTLLVSGILDAVLESRVQGHKPLETPHLGVKYQVPNQSFHCTGGEPWRG